MRITVTQVTFLEDGALIGGEPVNDSTKVVIAGADSAGAFPLAMAVASGMHPEVEVPEGAILEILERPNMAGSSMLGLEVVMADKVSVLITSALAVLLERQGGEMAYTQTEDIITLAEAAEQLGLAQVSLRSQAAKGVLRARLIGKTYVTTKAEVERYRREHLGRLGRPTEPRPTEPRPSPRGFTKWSEIKRQKGA